MSSLVPRARPPRQRLSRPAGFPVLQVGPAGLQGPRNVAFWHTVAVWMPMPQHWPFWAVGHQGLHR
eukprot:10580817-Lingulodinium_polyedra.AAC.1